MAPDSKTEIGSPPSAGARSTMAGMRLLGDIARKSFCELRALADVDGNDPVGKSRLLEEDRDLMAVRRGPVMEVDHVRPSSAGSEDEASCPHPHVFSQRCACSDEVLAADLHDAETVARRRFEDRPIRLDRHDCRAELDQAPCLELVVVGLEIEVTAALVAHALDRDMRIVRRNVEVDEFRGVEVRPIPHRVAENLRPELGGHGKVDGLVTVDHDPPELAPMHSLLPRCDLINRGSPALRRRGGRRRRLRAGWLRRPPRRRRPRYSDARPCGCPCRC